MIKRRILVWADSPTVATGFAQVSRNILKELHKTGRYEIDMVGINYYGDYDRDKFEKEYGFISRLVPAQYNTTPDLYGRENLIRILAGEHPVLKPPYDIFFSIQDHFIIHQKDSSSSKGLGQAIKTMQKNTLMAKEFRENHFVWVGYFPVDSVLKPTWVHEAIGMCDYPVAYCEYGRDEILKHDTAELHLHDRLKVIYHGTNTKDFYPADAETKARWRKDLFKEKADHFILMSVARNQPRKDLFKTLLVFREWLKTHPKSLLYMHCDPIDPSGANIFDTAQLIGVPLSNLVFTNQFQAHRGVPIAQLNKIYNSADAFITTTLGEGWGLPITEAMACKLPVYAPYHTAIKDILGAEEGMLYEDGRGVPFAAGSNPTEWITFGNTDNELPRPITNVESALHALKWGYENPDKLALIVERAYAWIQEHTWEKEVEKWTTIFDEACEVNDQLRKGVGVVEKKLGRNDICPLCLDKKIKNCKKHRDIYLQ